MCQDLLLKLSRILLRLQSVSKGTDNPWLQIYEWVRVKEDEKHLNHKKDGKGLMSVWEAAVVRRSAAQSFSKQCREVSEEQTNRRALSDGGVA